MKTLLKNCKIYDGSGLPASMGEVLINGDKIEAVSYVGKDDPIKVAKTTKVIDLGGKSIAPGFIDMHSHNDWFAIKKNPLPYFEPFIRQGITTFITGNCGLSAVGFDKDTPNVDKIGGGLFGYRNETTGIYPTAGELLDAVDGNAPCNIATLVGHCSARASIAGYENRELTEAETEEMLKILEDSLKSGAMGVSLGLMYEPGVYGNQKELKKVVDLCVKYDKPLTVHPRAESKVSMAYPELVGRSHLLRAFDDLIEISEGTNLKLQYSHAIFVGRRTLGDFPEFLKLVDKVRASGVRMQFDIYNELRGVSVITVILPDWYRGMSEAERNKPVTKLKLNALINATSLLLGFGYDDIEVAYIGPGYEEYEGKTVAQLAKEYGMKPLDMYLKLCKESDFNGRVNMGPYTTNEIIHSFENNPLCLYMTDAWVEDYGVQNPVLYDCFPKFLKDSLNGIGDTMPQTIRRMTGASADRFEIKDRGYLKPGYFADLTVFDEGVIKKARYGQNKAFGIEKVFINGKLVLDDDKLDEKALKTSGRAVRA